VETSGSGEGRLTWITTGAGVGQGPRARQFSGGKNIDARRSVQFGPGMTSPIVVTVVSHDGSGKSVWIEIVAARETMQ
jgi:hypothetical protein